VGRACVFLFVEDMFVFFFKLYLKKLKYIYIYIYYFNFFFCVFMILKIILKKLKNIILIKKYFKKLPNHIYKEWKSINLVGRAHVGVERRVMLIVIMYGKNDCVPHNFSYNHGINEIKIQSCWHHNLN